MLRTYLWVGLAFGGVCLTTPLLHARVFTTRRIDFFTPSSYGRLIYKTMMEINGGKAEVNVVACDEGLAVVRAALTANKDPSLHLVALSSGPDKPVLLVSVVQSQAEKMNAQAQQARHRLTDVPVPGDGAVLNTMKSGDTRTTFERLSSRMQKGEVIRFFEQGMGEKGWTKQVGTGEESGFLFYVKGTDVCMVLVTVEESNGETGITLLHKQGAVN